MKSFQFIGHADRVYPEIVIDGETLVAHPLDVRAFDEPPGDGLWIEAPAAVALPAKPAKAAASKES